MKSINIITLLLLPFFIVSCTKATKALWSGHKYDERVGGFFITENADKLVVIGEQYHYVFKLDTGLRNILSSPKRKELKPKFRMFKVDDENRIKGSYTLFYTNRDDSADEWLITKGFKKGGHHPGGVVYRFNGKLEGVRYAAGKSVTSQIKFSKDYFVKVEQPSSMLGTAGKVIATPVAIAADGVMTIGGTVMFIMFATTSVIFDKH